MHTQSTIRDLEETREKTDGWNEETYYLEQAAREFDRSNLEQSFPIDLEGIHSTNPIEDKSMRIADVFNQTLISCILVTY